jgi:septum formation protein
VEQQAELVLASGSPRRRDILEQLGVRFRVLVSGADEGDPTVGTPETHARSAADAKGSAVARLLQAQGDPAAILAADTIVVIDGVVLGKPAGDADGARMLRVLSGRQHEVITAVRIEHAVRGFAQTIAVRSVVNFRVLDEATVLRYVASGEGRDKAGSYAVQGLGAGLVRAIAGSYSNVVGLPAVETLELLQAARVLGAWP